MRQFKMLTRNIEKNVATNEKCILKNGLKISKPKLQNFKQSSILEQGKVA